MTWQIVVLAAIILAVGIAVSAGTIEKHRRMVGLRQNDRTISWAHALERVRAGHGALVENTTSMPCRFWWIEDLDAVEQVALYHEVEERGLCVKDAPSRKSVEQTVSDLRLSERYRQLYVEPLVD